MSLLPDGTNAYGRILNVMREIAKKTAEENSAGARLVKGEYLGNKKFSVGSMTLDEGDYLLIQHDMIIDGHHFVIPGLEDQAYTIVVNTYYGVRNIPVKVPSIKKGDMVIAYQFGDEEFLILGKAVE